MRKNKMDRRWPWMVGGVDIEGVVGALIAIIAGFLLGMIWGPLFWLGVAAALVILLATRTAERVRPDVPGLITAPCDGVVDSIQLAPPPLELGMGADPLVRVRIAASPLSPNGIYAPMAGTLEDVRLKEGERSAVIANRPETPGLSQMTAQLSGTASTIGLHICASGLGPRLQWLVDNGDTVEAGERIGVRRLGGWCDLYLAEGAETSLLAGQTLVGGETPVMAGDQVPATPTTSATPLQTPPPEPDPEPEPEPEAIEETPPEAEPDTEAEPEEADTADDTSKASRESAVAALQRLRDRARKTPNPD